MTLLSAHGDIVFLFAVRTRDVAVVHLLERILVPPLPKHLGVQHVDCIGHGLRCFDCGVQAGLEASPTSAFRLC